MDRGLDLERLVLDIRMLGLDGALAAMLAVSPGNGRSEPSEGSTFAFQALPMLPWLRTGVLLSFLLAKGSLWTEGFLV